MVNDPVHLLLHKHQQRRLHQLHLLHLLLPLVLPVLLDRVQGVLPYLLLHQQ
jgi:hypothetical protein